MTEQAKRTISREERRHVVRFSCGAASAVAAKIMVSKSTEPLLIVNAFIAEEHVDNRRFLADCEIWLSHPIQVLRDEKYGASTHEVWRRKRFMRNRFMAPCSGALKGDLLKTVSLPDDVTVLGYTTEECDRADRLVDRFPDETFRFPLIEAGLKKSDCLAIIERAGIELPAMYRLGYQNANCIGCIKGGEGYWNKIRRDFPEKFIQIAEIQKEIGPGAYLFRNRKTGVRFSLYDLPLNAGRYQDEPEISCGFVCEQTERELSEASL